MKCPKCGDETSVIDSRVTPCTTAMRGGKVGHEMVRRRRGCRCTHRFTTHESLTEENPEARIFVMESQIEELNKEMNAVKRILKQWFKREYELAMPSIEASR